MRAAPGGSSRARLHPWVEAAQTALSTGRPMTRPAHAPTLRHVSAEHPPTLASLAQARARRRATASVLRPIGVGVVLLVGVGASRAQPRPGLSGDHLGVLAALVGFGAGLAGVLLTRRSGPGRQAVFFAVLVLSASALVWLQPDGPGFVGAFVAVGVAAMRVRGWAGALVAGTALAALALAGVLSGARSASSILLSEVGVIAFFLVARLAQRLGEGQEQAEQLLIQLERSREAQAQAAVLAERQRLAREMHDVLAHSLSGLVLQLEGARMLAERDGASPDVASAVERAHHLARAGLDESRRAIGMLRDDELPGPERLTALAEEFERDAGVPCATAVTGVERDLGSEARLTLYRVAQEALTNVRRHARPQRVELRLDYRSDGARLTVEDFGSDGPPPPPGSGGGYGLTGMRERADLLGATLTTAATDSGFRVELWVPA
jgi:signal transduction histidine kinase